MNTLKIFAFNVILFACFVSTQAQDRKLSSVDDIPLQPNASAGEIDSVQFVFPVIDASKDVQFEVSSTFRMNKVFQLKNRGTQTINLWVFSLRKSAQGTIFFAERALAHLAPGEVHKTTLTYMITPGGKLYGEYRLVYAANYFSQSVKPNSWEANQAGQKDIDLIKAFTKRVEEAYKAFQ